MSRKIMNRKIISVLFILGLLAMPVFAEQLTVQSMVYIFAESLPEFELGYMIIVLFLAAAVYFIMFNTKPKVKKKRRVL